MRIGQSEVKLAAKSGTRREDNVIGGGADRPSFVPFRIPVNQNLPNLHFHSICTRK